MEKIKEEDLLALVREWVATHKDAYLKNREKFIFDMDSTCDYVTKLEPGFEDEVSRSDADAPRGIEEFLINKGEHLQEKLYKGILNKDPKRMSAIYFMYFDGGYEELANRSLTLSKRDDIDYRTKVMLLYLRVRLLYYSFKAKVKTNKDWENYVLTTGDDVIKKALEDLKKEEGVDSLLKIFKVSDYQMYADRIYEFLKVHNDRLGVGALQFELEQHNIIEVVSKEEFREAIASRYPDIQFKSANNYQSGYKTIKECVNRRSVYPEIYAALDQVFEI